MYRYYIICCTILILLSMLINHNFSMILHTCTIPEITNCSVRVAGSQIDMYPQAHLQTHDSTFIVAVQSGKKKKAESGGARENKA